MADGGSTMVRVSEEAAAALRRASQLRGISAVAYSREVLVPMLRRDYGDHLRELAARETGAVPAAGEATEPAVSAER